MTKLKSDSDKDSESNIFAHKWLKIITNKSDSHKWLQITVIVTNDFKFTSNVIEVVRPVLNLLFFFTKIFYTHQKHKTIYSKQKDFTHTKSTKLLIANRK